MKATLPNVPSFVIKIEPSLTCIFSFCLYIFLRQYSDNQIKYDIVENPKMNYCWDNFEKILQKNI